MKRVEALQAVYDDLKDCVVVTIMGAVAAELYSLGHRPNFFYLEHAMGLASSMGLGIALSQPQRKVAVLDGDGSILMNLGSLTTLARYAPANLVHVVFDNEVLLSVGKSFTTATQEVSDLAEMARGAGIPRVGRSQKSEQFAVQFREALESDEMSTLVAKVAPEGPSSYFIGCHMLENRFEFQRFLSGKVGETQEG